jgi:hypothetical protein
MATATASVSPARATRLDSAWFETTLALVAAVLGWMANLSHGIDLTDEAWFLQVVTRVVHGNALYRDVFFGVTPLSVFLSQGLAWIFGAQILVVKGLMVGCVATIVWLAARTARQVSSPSVALVIVVLPLLIWYQPLPQSPYNCLTTTLYAACLLLAVASLRASDGWCRWKLGAAAVCAGLCFATKHNGGALALGALTVATLAHAGSARVRLRTLGRVWCVFGIVAALCLLPVWLSGGFPAFLDYCVLNKPLYLRMAAIPYSDVCVAAITCLLRANVRDAFPYAPLVLPPLCLVLLLAAMLRATPEQRRMGLALAAFAAGGFAFAYPKYNASHLKHTMVAQLVALAWAWHVLGRGRSGRSWRLAALGLPLLCVLGMLTIGDGSRLVAAGRQVPQDTGPFAGARLEAGMLRAVADCRAALQSDARRGVGRVFFASDRAAFWYLAMGLSNATPFDYPMATAFGRAGEGQVIDWIADRRIDAVVLDVRLLKSSLRPTQLVAYAEQHMRPGPVLPCGQVYYRQ